jgi:hypothetical protein
MQSDRLLLDHRWLAEHAEEGRRFAGQYIAVVEGAIVAHGCDVKQVYAQAKRFGPQPLIAKIRQPQVMVTVPR